jgi:formylglycine-generating enzyme required for sulfatase activity
MACSPNSDQAPTGEGPAEKQAKIDIMLREAQADDRNDAVFPALAALNDLLTLDPQNTRALMLRDKILGYCQITNSVGMVFMKVGPGNFMMGSPANEPGRLEDETQHQVTLSSPIFMETTLVTQKQWLAVMPANPSRFIGENLPVERVSVRGALNFCKLLGQREGKEYRLPTEAEWEYCCRAGTQTAYFFGDNAAGLGEYAWSLDSQGVQRTHPVGRKKPNAWGFYDMQGNCGQWCSDIYAEYDLAHLVDPTGPSDRSLKPEVLRGGSTSDFPRFCRCAVRFFNQPDYSLSDIGLRVVMVAAK